MHFKTAYSLSLFCTSIYPLIAEKCIENIGSIILLAANGDQRLPTYCFNHYITEDVIQYFISEQN